MSDIAPGWYKDPADPTTQRYWDGEGWLGAALPADATPPAGPPAGVIAPPPPPPPKPAAVPPPVPAAPPPTPVPPIGAPPLPPGWTYAMPYPGRRPTPRPHGMALANVGARLVARLVDMLGVLVLVVVADAWIAREFWSQFGPFLQQAQEAQATGGTQPNGTQLFYLLLAMCAVAAAVWFAYEVPATANSGQTLGKKLLGIKVVRIESADRLGMSRSLRRWSRMGIPTLFWSCYGVGFLLQFLDCLFVAIDRPLHQALHDKGAATVVVEVPRARKTPLENATPGGQDAHPR